MEDETGPRTSIPENSSIPSWVVKKSLQKPEKSQKLVILPKKTISSKAQQLREKKELDRKPTQTKARQSLPPQKDEESKSSDDEGFFGGD